MDSRPASWAPLGRSTRSWPYDNITLRPSVPAKPDNGQSACYDLGRFTSGPPDVLLRSTVF